MLNPKNHLKYLRLISRPQKTIQSFAPIAQLYHKLASTFTIKKKSSKIWMNEHINDAYVKKAKLVT